MRKTFALIMAAALLAGSAQIALGEDTPLPRDDPRMAGEVAAYGGWGRGPGWGRGHPGRHDGFRRGDAGPRDWGRGPGRFEGCPGFDGPRHRSGPGHRFGGMGMGMGHGMGRMPFAQLDLTADQKARLIDVATTQFRAGLEAKMEMMDAQKKLWDLRDDDSASSDAIIQANAAVGAAKGKLEALRNQAKDEFAKVLTPEQLKKLEERRVGPPPFGDRRFEDGRPGPGPRGPGHHGDRMPGPRPRR